VAHRLTIDRRWLLRSAGLLLWPAMNARASTDPLAGSEWRPTLIDGVVFDVGTPLFVQFKAAEALFVFSGCNYISGKYRISGAEILISVEDAPVGDCAGDGAKLELTLLAALRGARRFERRQARLRFFAADGNPLAEFAQTDWD